MATIKGRQFKLYVQSGNTPPTDDGDYTRVPTESELTITSEAEDEEYITKDDGVVIDPGVRRLIISATAQGTKDDPALDRIVLADGDVLAFQVRVGDVGSPTQTVYISGNFTVGSLEETFAAQGIVERTFELSSTGLFERNIPYRALNN